MKNNTNVSNSACMGNLFQSKHQNYPFSHKNVLYQHCHFKKQNKKNKNIVICFNIILTKKHISNKFSISKVQAAQSVS